MVHSKSGARISWDTCCYITFNQMPEFYDQVLHVEIKRKIVIRKISPSNLSRCCAQCARCFQTLTYDQEKTKEIRFCRFTWEFSISEAISRSLINFYGTWQYRVVGSTIRVDTYLKQVRGSRIFGIHHTWEVLIDHVSAVVHCWSQDTPDYCSMLVKA